MFHVFSLEPISSYLTIYLSKKTDLYEYTLGHHRLIYVLDNLLYTHSQFLCKFSVYKNVYNNVRTSFYPLTQYYVRTNSFLN